jgi:aspartate kinase
MKVMKFGGTSVGQPRRMQDVATLITADNSPKIVVLSAVSGTTNALVEISTLLGNGERTVAKQKIDLLEKQYRVFIGSSLTTTR